MFDPTRLGKYLLEFSLSHGLDCAGVVEYDCARTGSSLIQSQNVCHLSLPDGRYGFDENWRRKRRMPKSYTAAPSTPPIKGATTGIHHSRAPSVNPLLRNPATT